MKRRMERGKNLQSVKQGRLDVRLIPTALFLVAIATMHAAPARIDLFQFGPAAII